MPVEIVLFMDTRMLVVATGLKAISTLLVWCINILAIQH